MGYRYQNKLDEEREHAHWQNASWLYKLLYRLLSLCVVLLVVYGSFGWVIVKLILW